MAKCMRCSVETNVTIMSMFNEDILCMECKDKEAKHSDYKWARDVEHQAVCDGNYNFAGIGKPSDL